MRSISFTAEDLFLDGTAHFGHPLDYEKTFSALEDNINRKNRMERYYKLGICHLHGYGCERNTVAAIEYFTYASQEGHASASYCLYRLNGDMEYLLVAVMQNHQFAKLLLQRDHAKEIFAKAMAVIKNDMHRHEVHKAFTHLQALGMSGHAEAYYQLAVHNEKNAEEPETIANSFNWALQAAQLGHTEAQAHVAKMYMQGRGTTRDLIEGMKWHEKAAKGGNAESKKLVSKLLDS